MTATERPIELLPCPFCGGDAEIDQFGDRRKSTIYSCTECGCRLETSETFAHGAIWNRRTLDAAPADPAPTDSVSIGSKSVDAVVSAECWRRAVTDYVLENIGEGIDADEWAQIETYAVELAREGK